MGAHERQPVPALIDRLEAEPQGFDFHQAVRLLEIARGRGAPGRVTPPAAGADPSREAARLRGDISRAFPPGDITGLEREDGDEPATLTAAFMALAGAFGPLPAPLAELVLERARRGDMAPRDFLDIFNHRLLSLLVRAKRTHTPALQPDRPEDTPFADYLWAFLGLLTAGQRHGLGHGARPRMLGHESGMLEMAGLLNQRPLSLHAIERLVSNHFGFPVKGESFVGRWLEIDPEERTALGSGGRNTVLGRDAVLGGRVWDQGAAIRLALGPMPLAVFVRFLPGGPGWRALRVLLGTLLGGRVEVELRLLLSPNPAFVSRPTTQPKRAAPRLGWTAWLNTKPRREPMSLTLSMGAPAGCPTPRFFSPACRSCREG